MLEHIDLNKNQNKENEEIGRIINLYVSHWQKKENDNRRCPKIVAIDVIHNPILKEKWLLKKKEIETKELKTKWEWAFHGTPLLADAKSIAVNGFSTNKIGMTHKNTGYNDYGRGIYFSSHSSTAAWYNSKEKDKRANFRGIILSQVLLGKQWKWKTDDILMDRKDGYDSHVSKDGLREWVVFESEQILPRFILYFSP